MSRAQLNFASYDFAACLTCGAKEKIEPIFHPHLYASFNPF
jgi:hypothetical protein